MSRGAPGVPAQSPSIRRPRPPSTASPAVTCFAVPACRPNQDRWKLPACQHPTTSGVPPATGLARAATWCVCTGDLGSGNSEGCSLCYHHFCQIINILFCNICVYFCIKDFVSHKRVFFCFFYQPTLHATLFQSVLDALECFNVNIDCEEYSTLTPRS